MTHASLLIGFAILYSKDKNFMALCFILIYLLMPGATS